MKIRRLPDWMKVRSPLGKNYIEMKRLLKEYSVNTICQNALCPNIGRCFNSGVNAFLILGKVCTRHCKYCNVSSSKPEMVNDAEAKSIAKIVNHFRMKHAVVTSVTRDDLSDGGAFLFVKTIKEIRKINHDTTVEVLIPDFNGCDESLKVVIFEKPDVLNHNIETVERLYPVMRPQADYKRSLELLKKSKEIDKNLKTKSGLMVGLGETKDEVVKAIKDLREVACDMLIIGQYLSPSEKHYPINRFYHPDEFMEMQNIGMEMGFLEIKSTPLARSSYQFD
ncbi:lipoyl synthase [candidate division KSB1 bacterium]